MNNQSSEQPFIEKKWGRVLLLALGIAPGVAMLYYGFPDSFVSDYYMVGEKVPVYFAQFIAAIPVFLLLWAFRTYDTRQQIEETQAQIRHAEIQIHQNNLAEGLRLLTSNDEMKIAVGVELLIEVSYAVSDIDSEILDWDFDFNSIIFHAFVKRLQYLPVPIDGDPAQYLPKSPDGIYHISITDQKISYTVDILRWLGRHKRFRRGVKLDCAGFSYSEFGPPTQSGWLKKISSTDIRRALQAN